MRFAIVRVSDTMQQRPPIPEAIDCGPVTGDNAWMTEKFGGRRWEVEVTTLEELLAIVVKHGKIIVGPTWIQIYDGYRE